MSSFLFFLIIAIVEYFLILIMTNQLYISIKYSCFGFDIEKDAPIGMNIIIQSFFPTIVLIILSGLLYTLKLNNLVLNIFLITIIYHILRISIIIILNKIPIINWKRELICAFFSIFMSVIIYYCFISKTTQIFVSIDEIRDGIWIAIIIFFIKFVMSRIYDDFYLNEDYQIEKMTNYVIKMYEKFNAKYSKIINSKIDDVNYITYSIMIYENYNRPPIFRLFEYVKLFICGHASLGIMQVYSKRFIKDTESVQIAFKMIENEYNNLTKNKKISKIKKVERIAFFYNKRLDYVKEVTSIYKTICNVFE